MATAIAAPATGAGCWRWLLAALVAGLLGLFCYFALNRREGPKAELKRAMERNEFFLHYQPVLALEDLSVTGAEVLMRWRHPVQGLIAPDIFIRAAEDIGLIVELTRHLFTLLEKELAQWEGGRFKLGVNLAAEHLHDGTLTRDLLALKGRLPANIQLVAELTERQLIGEDPLVLKQLQDCRAAGIQIAIDDFGTGHSSLAYLERLPVDYLKIDKSFVSALDSGSVQAPVLEAIIQLGHRLGMELLAEGIETERQAQFLRAKGVEYGQGYFYARPMPAPTLRQWLATAGSAAAANLTALRKEAGKKPD
ncbi:MAG: EAL domain-containing protein [Pseudomonadota bacterium]|nr:EAL domain-containing protein [Pseudomonadota bacterium]